VLGAVHAKVPMVTGDEQRALQLENAKADAQFWDQLADAHDATVADHKGLAASAERTAATVRGRGLRSSGWPLARGGCETGAWAGTAGIAEGMNPR
jgi:hypothetical protein